VGALSELPNIGEDTERLLNEVGITTFAELKEFYNSWK
jgi:predicted flap endonuclease-1-like 5' DNA nuclease